MAIYSTDVKELWRGECNFWRTYRDRQAKDSTRDWRKWKRGGCPQCGHSIRTDYGPAYAGQS